MEQATRSSKPGYKSTYLSAGVAGEYWSLSSIYVYKSDFEIERTIWYSNSLILHVQL